MKPEQLLWALVRQYFPGHYERIENTANTGTPDVHYVFNGSEVWVELKVAKTPDQNLFSLLRPEQKVWHLKHVINLGKVYVLVRDGMKLTLYQAKWPHANATVCNYVVLWSDSKVWDWETFQAVLRSA